MLKFKHLMTMLAKPIFLLTFSFVLLVSCTVKKKDTIVITNHSNEKIYVAVAYKNPSDRTISSGWESLTKDESIRYEGENENQKIYFLIHRNEKSLEYPFFRELDTERFIMEPCYFWNYRVGKTNTSNMVELSWGPEIAPFSEKNQMIQESLPKGWRWVNFYRHPNRHINLRILPNGRHDWSTQIE